MPPSKKQDHFFSFLVNNKTTDGALGTWHGSSIPQYPVVARLSGIFIFLLFFLTLQCFNETTI
nr:MAG TPA: hypothetical protein [Caudoviricetes sp.]